MLWRFAPFAAFLLLLLALVAPGALGHKKSSPLDFVEKTVSKVSCDECRLVATFARFLFGTEVTEETVVKIANFVCQHFIHHESAVCKGIGTQFREEFFYVLRKVIVNPDQICGLLFEECGDVTNPFGDWSIILPPRPGSIPPAKKAKRALRVLQLSDIHVDGGYDEDTEADCSLPLCCHHGYEHPDGKIRRPSGYWGTLGKCDVPFRLVENLLQHINATHTDVDYVLLTGDYMNHEDWNYTKQGHVKIWRQVSNLVRKYLPNKPTYWTVGNHEGVPVNSFAPHFADQEFWPEWIYEELKNANGEWVPNKSSSSLLYRGSYSLNITEGLRLISLNTNFCEKTNFFLYINQSDPDGTMSWFVNELYAAEKAGDRVQILAHIPPADGECLEGWARNYYLVVQRFAQTIVAQFFGHQHLDGFSVFYSDINDPNSTPLSVLYSAPSVTTFEFLNPAYRIYTLDDKFEISDIETYSTDLAVTSRDQPPVWKLLYKAKSAYNLTDLSASSWNNLASRIANEPLLQGEYFKRAFRTEQFDCDAACRHSRLCALRSGHHNETAFCFPNPAKTNRP